jgi:hypothetical protein
VTSNAVCINQQYLSDDFDWQALGSRRLDNVNNFELTEWLIGQGATLRFDKALFFPEAKEPGKYLKGHVYDTTEHRPPRAKIAIHRADGTEEAVNVFIVHERREDVIRRAVNDTFPHAITLNDMLKTRLGVSPDNVTVGDLDVIDSDSDNVSTEPPEPAHDDLGPSVKRQRTRTTLRSYPGKHVAAVCTAGKQVAEVCTAGASLIYNAFNVTAPRAGLRHKKRSKKLHMHNDTAGSSFVALTATMHACLMAAEYGYNAAFIPPEPRSQRDARQRADSDRWLQAEKKELDTLMKMDTFELVDRPKDTVYDPLPLQFVYKLKVKDGDFDNCIYKARLVVRGNLQFTLMLTLTLFLFQQPQSSCLILQLTQTMTP